METASSRALCLDVTETGERLAQTSKPEWVPGQAM